VFDFIAYPLANIILLFYHLLGNQTVLAITALTILINLALYPLTQGQQKSAERTQALQPEIEKLKKKYGNDKERLQQEQMKLYREMGINPLSGCLPLLIQMPIWFGLYQAIRYCIPSTPLEVFQFSHHIYKWLPGVIGLVPLQSTFLGMDLGQPPGMPQWWSYALPVLVFATSWLQQKLLTPPTPSGDKSQAAMMSQQMQIMMPLMFGVFSIQFAAGLSIYFIISNLIRIAQYYITRPKAGRAQPAAEIEAPKAQKPALSKKSKAQRS
jgi:YidC/Oxa1 family membrane protein insertase